MRKKVIFWAAGANAEKFAGCLREDVTISAFMDNDALRWGEEFCGSAIACPADIGRYEYDYIVITTPDYGDILEQLKGMGIDDGRIITPFAPDRCGREGWRGIFHTGELMYYVLELRMTSMSRALENAPYEISAAIEKGHIKTPIVHSVYETLEKLREGYSMSRYGDGELNMILGRNFSTFQAPDKRLIARLKEILKNKIPKHIVCLSDVYGDLLF